MRKGKKSLLEPRDKTKLKIEPCGCILDSEEEIAEFWEQNREPMTQINYQSAFLVNRNPQNDFEYFANIVGKYPFFGQAQVQVRSRLGPGQVLVRSRSGSGQVPVRSRSGPSQVQVAE